jgi:hypothetical protein
LACLNFTAVFGGLGRDNQHLNSNLYIFDIGSRELVLSLHALSVNYYPQRSGNGAYPTFKELILPVDMAMG